MNNKAIGIVIGCILYFAVTLWIVYDNKIDNFNLRFLNYKSNYIRWNKMNWFGIIVTTTLINIVYLPYAILYWLWKLIVLLFTIGRKNDDKPIDGIDAC